MGCENNLAACNCSACAAGAGSNIGLALTPTSVPSIIDRIAGAFDQAVHKGGGPDSIGIASGYPFSTPSRSNVIPFPMVNAYRPLLRTRVPVAGLNAFPKVDDIVNIGYRVSTFNTPNGEDRDEEGFAGFGDFFNTGSFSFGPPVQEYPQGVSLPGSGGIPTGSGSTLQSILDAISRTLPATISAFKKQPYSDAYYDPSRAGQQQQQPYQPQYGIPPSGYSYNSSGQLVKDAVGSVTDFVSNNPLLVGGAALGIVLLFMQSPRRR